MLQAYSFYTLDVFTDDVFTDDVFSGNPLAVVLDSAGLSPQRKQAIAREFNLSETVFVLPPDDARHRAALRIFTPVRELPFAGHPTIGTACLLALLDANEDSSAVVFGLEETIGTISCAVTVEAENKAHARFRLPLSPTMVGEGIDVAAAAWALSLDPGEIGFGRHAPSRYSAGAPFDFIPVRSLDAIAKARPSEGFAKVFQDSAVYLYTQATIAHAHHFHARMFAPHLGIFEDPATGSAVAAFAGVLMQFEPLSEGEHSFIIEQGYEMGRPSQIGLHVVLQGGALDHAEISGRSVIVSEGRLKL